MRNANMIGRRNIVYLSPENVHTSSRLRRPNSPSMSAAPALPPEIMQFLQLCRLDGIAIDGVPSDSQVTHTNSTAANRSYVKLTERSAITLHQTMLSSISIAAHESWAPDREPSSSCSQTSRTLLEIVCSEIRSNMQLTPSQPNVNSDPDGRNVLIISRHRSDNLTELKAFTGDPTDSTMDASESLGNVNAEPNSPDYRQRPAATETASVPAMRGASDALLSLSDILNRLHSVTYPTVLRGLQDLLCLAPQLNSGVHERQLITIYRQLLVCCRSPRTVMVRTTCQVSGVLFGIVRCTHRPEFDELVQALLQRTADTNRLLQADANGALDKMVAAVAAGHSVRALCSHGLPYRNSVVRCSVARLLCSVCRLHGNEALLGATANELTRKRLLGALARLLTDKCQECRRAAEELCGLMQSHRLFADYFYRDLELRKKMTLMRTIRRLNCK